MKTELSGPFITVGYADLKIYFVEYENQAGWRNMEKIHLMY